MSSIASHASHLHYLYTHGNHEGMRILEVGSREVTGPSAGRQMFTKAEYIGFDYYPGKNVDVVGDAHRLSSYFPPGEKFDIIYSSACFEHFAMPWVVAVEIAKLLNILLFSPALGFECIEAGFSNPQSPTLPKRRNSARAHIHAVFATSMLASFRRSPGSTSQRRLSL
jgi:hypothetical protein